MTGFKSIDTNSVRYI